MCGSEPIPGSIATASAVYLPLFVIAELHYGFRGGSKLRHNLLQLERLLAKPTVEAWMPTLDTAQMFGEVQNKLKRAGSPMPINDIWIASSCIEPGSVLVTFDRHFEAVPGLRLWLPE